ncbi:MAG: hypothetical protein Q7S64_01205 [bacterium]|nr:hypothetical protein [bacterium]
MNNINLLPTSRKRVIALDRYAPKVRLLMLCLVAALAVIYAYALTQRLRLQQSTKEAERAAQVKSPEVERYDAVATQAKQLSTKAQEYFDVVNQDRDWGNIFTLFKEALPPNAQLTSVTTSSSGAVTVVNLTGSAGDDKAVGVLREKILAVAKDNTKLHLDVTDATIDSIAVSGNDTAAQNFTMRVTLTLKPNHEQ